ncbi:MAG: hypothetical protein V4461_01155 [Pseudomonadota bacterium]|tara:strand:- start:2223 stop:3176 length:954 start_codon:yes stop_codon:yes gene_type:complete
MLRCTFTFGQIEELLAKAHRIDPAKRTAFHGRLKHLQRWGFPSGEKPGKGKAISYSAEHLYMMVLVMELIQAGMPPKLSADLIRDNWNDLRTTIYLNMVGESERREAGYVKAEDWCWLFRPEALREITVEGVSEYDHMEAVLAIEVSALAKHLTSEGDAHAGDLGRSWRTLVINGGPLVRGIALLIDKHFGWATDRDLCHDFLNAVEQAQSMLDGALASLDGLTKEIFSRPRAQRSVAERYPAAIVAMAKDAMAGLGSLIAKIDVPTGDSVEFRQEELQKLRDAGILAVEMEGVILTERGHLIRELLQEERDRGEHS